MLLKKRYIVCAMASEHKPMNDNNHVEHSLQTLRVYHYYRIAVSGMLFGMFLAGISQEVLGRVEPQLFQWAAGLYFASCVFALVAFPAKALTHSLKRISGLLLIDVCALLLMIHASGGIESGIGYLLILASAVISIFIRGQLAFAFSALITIVLIGNTLFLYLDRPDLYRKLFSAGILSTLIFTTSISFYYLTEKLRRAGAETAAQAKHIRNLQLLAENIVTRMQTGVVVLGEGNRIELMNDAARQLLHFGKDETVFGKLVDEVDALKNIIDLSSQQQNASLIYKLKPELEIRVNFSHQVSELGNKTIIYLEDHRAIKQYAQHIKLASLGKLSASIAHEIRNPLGSISHAAQLLSESNDISSGDTRMIEIIVANSHRVNEIVDNIMAISRRREPKPERIEIQDWLKQYVSEYQSTHDCHIELDILSEQLAARCDPSQLRQVITNLVDNGIRYSRKKTGHAKLLVKSGLADDDEKTYIEIIDFGPGIPEDQIQKIYEPFFTTDDKGTGLGLYISRELCEINHASLHYYRNEHQQSCFRIDFPHHQRVR
jgi:two-component system sensor histidine kinase PilS (NtrC family)